MAKTDSLGIKEALEAGVTPEELIAGLKDEIDKAQEEIAAEEADVEDELDLARQIMIESALDYCIVAGIMKEPSDEDYEEAVDTLIDYVKDMEEQLKIVKPLIDAITAMAEKSEDVPRSPRVGNADRILADFLKTLS